MLIKYQLSFPGDWIQTIGKALETEITDQCVHIPPHLGSGFLKVYPVATGVHMTAIHVKLAQPFTLIRVPADNNDYFILNFVKSTHQITNQLESEVKPYSMHGAWGYYFCCPRTFGKIEIPPGKEIQIFNMTVSKSWIENQVVEAPDSFWAQQLASPHPVYLYNTLNFQKRQWIQQVTLSPHLSKLALLQTQSIVLNLLADFFEHTASRTLEEPYTDIHPDDLKGMFASKQYLEAHYTKFPGLDTLAEMAQCSKSKYKVLFKQIFGMPPQKYFDLIRANYAKELLENSDLTVSQVGYEMGYSNLGFFSKKFKEHFGVLPNEVKNG